VLAQTDDVLDWHKHTVAAGVLEVEILRLGTVGSLELAQAHVSTDPVCGVHDKLAG
jgi:hypothetical protein